MEILNKETNGTNSRKQLIQKSIKLSEQTLSAAHSVCAVFTGASTSEARQQLQMLLDALLREVWVRTAANAGVTRAAFHVRGQDDKVGGHKDDGIGRSPMYADTKLVVAAEQTELYEDWLWKKVYYEPISMAKKLKKVRQWSNEEVSAARQHVEGGIRHYLTLVKLYASLHTIENTNYAFLTRCLCYLGDLSRYWCVDFPPVPVTADNKRYRMSCIYYSQALQLLPNTALAHNNLAVVMDRALHQPLIAVLHFLAAQTLPKPFPGARVLAQQLLSEHAAVYKAGCRDSGGSVSPDQRLLHTVLAVVHCFFKREETLEELAMVCQDFLLQLYKCVQHKAGLVSDARASPAAPSCPGQFVMDCHGLLSVTALLTACHKRATEAQGSTCAVLLASVLLTLVSHCSTALQRAITALHPVDLPQPHNKVDGDNICSGSPPWARSEGSKKKKVFRRRRRRGRRSQQAEDSDSSSWSDSDKSSCSDSDSYSQDSSGPDVIIESDSEDDSPKATNWSSSQPCPGTQQSAPASDCTVTASWQCNNGAMSALEQLRLLSLSDDLQQPHAPSPSPPVPSQPSLLPDMGGCRSRLGSYGAVIAFDATVGCRSVMASVTVLVAWLRSESLANGAVIWSKGGNGIDSRKVESARDLWKNLALYCNFIRINLDELGSVDSSKELPNLQEFLSKSACKSSLSEVMKSDEFVLFEDEFLKSVLPSVVPQHVHSRSPVVLCQLLETEFCKLGIMKLHSGPSIASDLQKMSAGSNLLSMQDKEPLEMSAITCEVPCSLLNKQETTLIRALRLHLYVQELSQLEDCPLEYSSDNGIFTLLSSPGTSSSGGSSTGTADSKGCSPHRGFYYKKTVGNHVMNKVVNKSYSKPSKGAGFYEHKNNNFNRRPKQRNGYRGARPEKGSARQSHDGSSRSSPRLWGYSASKGSNGTEFVPTSNDTAVNAVAGDRLSPVPNKVSPVIAGPGDSIDFLKSVPFVQNDALLDNTACKFGAIGDGRKVVGQHKAVDQQNQEEEERNKRRENAQHVLTERWLRHELSTSQPAPRTVSSHRYIVPDVLSLTQYLTVMVAVVRQRTCVVVVPAIVLTQLDEQKRCNSVARDASRWLEREMTQRGGCPSLRVQQNAQQLRRVPGVQYPPRQHRAAWRWFQILECCHHLARLEYSKEDIDKVTGRDDQPQVIPTVRMYSNGVSTCHSNPNSRPGTPKLSRPSVDISSLLPADLDPSLADMRPVVTLLTAESRDAIGKLPFSLNSLASSVATEVQFMADFQKAFTESASRKGHT